MLSSASAQELLKAVEPGTGYSHLKQWAIEHQLTFENFTKDTLLIRGAFSEGGGARYAVKLLARFCAGDDYSGRLFSATLQEFADSDKKSDIADAFAKERTYLDVLAGKTSEQGQFEGDYKLRREKISGMKGIAAGKSSDQGSWEVGLFFSSDYVVVQTTRHKDELCR
jgi:hypothetical protein